MRKLLIVFLLTLSLLGFTSCRRNRVQNPLAGLDSKQPDKVLFDRAMESMRKGKFEVSRTVLQTLINTYPDSEYIARAKLAVGDSWYAEGGSTGLAQAEIEYKDFITFFPNVPEAAEAQLKVANIHYRQMEKPDRDFTHARRAEEEYRNLVLQFPDSKLVPEAKQHLRQVQEVLAEREFRIGRFYFLRQSWAAAIARLKTLTDSYPLYSRADEALFMLGSAFENQIDLTRSAKGTEEVYKARLIQKFTDEAAQAYSQIVTRYPVMTRSGEAAKRLQALGRPVPTATPEAIAQNRAEEASRGETGTMGKVMGNFRRAPDVSQTAKVGEPNLTGTKDSSAPEFLREAQRTMMGTATEQGSGTVSVETVGQGAPAANQPAPKSAPAESASGESAREESVPAENPIAPAQLENQDQQQPSESTIPKPLDPAAPESAAPPPKPQADAPPPESSSPAASSEEAAPSPRQVNEVEPVPQGDASEQPDAREQQAAEQESSAAAKSEQKNTSSSKKKKKKAPPKVEPF